MPEDSTGNERIFSFNIVVTLCKGPCLYQFKPLFIIMCQIVYSVCSKYIFCLYAMVESQFHVVMKPSYVHQMHKKMSFHNLRIMGNVYFSRSVLAFFPQKYIDLSVKYELHYIIMQM